MKDKKVISIKTLNKSNVWDIQENDVIRMWEAAEKDADFKENLRHFKDIIKTAFEIEDVKIDKPVVIDKLEQRGFKVGTISLTTKTHTRLPSRNAQLSVSPTLPTRTSATSRRQSL